jgi:oligoendopeptidase F
MNKIFLVFVNLILISQLVMSQEMSRNRDEIPDRYKWNFEGYYDSWEAWEADFNKMDELKNEIVKYKGTLNESGKNLKNFVYAQRELSILGTKVYCYPYLLISADSRNQEVNKNLQKVQIFFSKMGNETSWATPEMLTIPEEKMMKWIAEVSELEPYRFFMSELYRGQKHILDDEKENLLSFYSPIIGTARDIYNELSTSDIDFNTITLESGEEMLITSGGLSKVLQNNSNTQKDRAAAYDAYYGAYESNINAYAAIYKNSLRTAWSVAQARNYNSCLESYLEGENIPLEVYTNLIKTAETNLEPLHRYYALRKKILGFEEYHPFDGNLKLIDYKKEYTYDEAAQMVIEAVAPLGKDYQEKVRFAVENGWIDVYETEGKRSGASSLGVYGVHPYIKMNWDNSLRVVFTLAHELGHSMHSMMSADNQDYINHRYSSLVAEVASTFNERLLLDYLLEKSDDPKEKIVLIDQAISNLVGKFYRQSMFADFELKAHELAEQGQPINKESLNKTMRNVAEKYYGDNVVYNDNLDMLWAVIHHYYTHKFYVYYYATSYAASAHLYNNATSGSKKEKATAIEKYLNLLKSGGNNFPIEQLKDAGVDMASPETILVLVKQMNELIDLLEVELEKI